jgi:hypothetical protein
VTAFSHGLLGIVLIGVVVLGFIGAWWIRDFLAERRHSVVYETRAKHIKKT